MLLDYIAIISMALSWGMSAQFDLRNGAIRKKYDALKYTLKKMEVRCWGKCTSSFEWRAD